MNIIWKGAHPNNFGVGRNGNQILKVVMHWIVGTLESADATFNSPTRLASAHYGVGPTEIHQYVKEVDTAWHAGNLTVNMQSIGIEHQGGPNLPIVEGTYKNSAELLADICKRNNIPLDRQHVVLHREIKSTQCPGTLDVDRIIAMAKEINNVPSPVAEPITISDPQSKVDFKGLKTLEETYGVLTVETLTSKLVAKDQFIHSHPDTAFTKPIAKLHYELAKEFEKQ